MIICPKEKNIFAVSGYYYYFQYVLKTTYLSLFRSGFIHYTLYSMYEYCSMLVHNNAVYLQYIRYSVHFIIFFSLYVHTETHWLAISKSHWFGIFHNNNNQYARGRGRGRAGEVWIGLNFHHWCSSRFITFAYCAPSPDFYATSSSWIYILYRRSTTQCSVLLHNT